MVHLYKVNQTSVEQLKTMTFSELKMTENDIEELLRKNIDMVCDDEESMLIVGKQVQNKELGRSDLTAIDNNGNIVLIEIKRDKDDITSRREAFEFQAIRYAASYATITEIDDLVEQIYAPYIERYRNEFDDEISNHLTSSELASRKIFRFLELNESINNFNEKQRIILVASDFDNETLSAVAWLNKNGVDISCFKLIPYIINEELFIQVDKVLPTVDYEEFYVDLLVNKKSSRNKKIKRRSLPKIKDMLDWGVVSAGDLLQAKDREEVATLLENGNVLVDGEEKSLQIWLKEVYGWQSVQTYAFTIHVEKGKTLSEIREAYMEKNEKYRR